MFINYYYLIFSLFPNKILNQNFTRILCGNLLMAKLAWPLKTLVKHSFWKSVGVPKCIVRVTSVVPSLY